MKDFFFSQHQCESYIRDEKGGWNKYLFFLGIDKPDIHKLYNAEITLNSLLYPKQFSDLYPKQFSDL
jgi:hypothetical protein